MEGKEKHENYTKILINNNTTKLRPKLGQQIGRASISYEVGGGGCCARVELSVKAKC